MTSPGAHGRERKVLAHGNRQGIGPLRLRSGSSTATDEYHCQQSGECELDEVGEWRALSAPGSVDPRRSYGEPPLRHAAEPLRLAGASGGESRESGRGSSPAPADV